MSAQNLLIAIACFFLLVNIKSALVSKPIYATKNGGHGSYGVTATQFVPNNSNDPKVFFMGNSVYYGTDIIPELYNIQATESTTFQIGNFGFTGASIYDYIQNYNHIKQFDPNLIVVQFNPTSFGYAGPFYRNDGYKNVLNFDNLRLYKEAFIRQTVSKDDLAEMTAFSILPIVSRSKIYRTYCNQCLKSLSRKFTSLRLWTFFPNKLNAVGEWANNKRKVATIKSKDKTDQDQVFDPSSGPKNEREYLAAEEALMYFITQLTADNQRAIFILQPSGFPKLPIMDKMESLLADHDLIQFVDNHDYFVKKLYTDKIHPNIDGAKLAAQRHFQLINSQFN